MPLVSRAALSRMALALVLSGGVARAQNVFSPEPITGGAAPAVMSPPPAAAPDAIPVVAAPKKHRIVVRTPPREAALATGPTPALTPDTFLQTVGAQDRYAAIADRGGWPSVPAGMRQGASGKGVLALRRRLAIEAGEEPSSSVAWDDELTDAVKRFQELHGLRQTGVVAGATLKAMNVSAAVRFRQLASSAQRLAGLTFAFGPRYVVVNIPSASVEAVEDGRVAHRYIAVVGDVDHRSPEVAAKIQAVNLNPTWTVPTSIIKNEIIPKMRRDPGYLARQKIRILDNRGETVNPASVDWSSERAVNYTLRQDSGAGNSLGSIRINMPNRDSVYMHDTPSKRLFGSDYRFLSHGCVRVEGVYDLASWILEGTSGEAGPWTHAALVAKGSDGERTDIKPRTAVPVVWVYLTGYATADGAVNFRDDVYGVDTVGEVASR